MEESIAYYSVTGLSPRTLVVLPSRGEKAGDSKHAVAATVLTVDISEISDLSTRQMTSFQTTKFHRRFLAH
jgi:hypothetical protein